MKEIDWVSIRSDRNKGLSYVELSKKYNVDRRTAKKYAENIEKPKYTLKNKKIKKLDKYEYFIDELLDEAPYSAELIKDAVNESFNENISYTTIQTYVKNKKHKLNNKATIRFETMPGLQGQVDWGFFENYKVYDEYGKEHKLYCFLMILGYSRMRYIEFVTDMSTATLIQCHINAFNYFGGYPNEILYDNMKQVVVKRLLRQKDSELNKQFEDFVGFFKIKPLLCRPYRGQTKGKIERTVRYVRENFMIGIKYKSLEDLNNKAYLWLEKINNKIHGTTNEIPKVRLIEENLNKITRMYNINKESVRKVEYDCLISYKNNKYSVPVDYIKRQVIVVSMDNILNIYCDGKIIATHPISKSKNEMIISKIHYDKLSKYYTMKQENTIFNDNSFNENIRIKSLGVYSV